MCPCTGKGPWESVMDNGHLTERFNMVTGKLYFACDTLPYYLNEHSHLKLKSWKTHSSTPKPAPSSCNLLLTRESLPPRSFSHLLNENVGAKSPPVPYCNNLSKVQVKVVNLSDEDGSQSLIEGGPVHVDGGPHGEHEPGDAFVHPVVLFETFESDGEGGRAEDSKTGHVSCVSRLWSLAQTVPSSLVSWLSQHLSNQGVRSSVASSRGHLATLLCLDSSEELFVIIPMPWMPGPHHFLPFLLGRCQQKTGR